MDIFDFSLQMENDAENLYRTLASKTEHPGIKKIFGMLADDENKHAKAIENLRKKIDPGKDNGSIPAVATIFSEIKKDVKEEYLSNDILDELNRALDIEKQGKEFYQEKFTELDSEAGRDLFKNLSVQENNHYIAVQNLIELIEKPKWWVEHAEFTPMGDDYY